MLDRCLLDDTELAIVTSAWHDIAEICPGWPPHDPGNTATSDAEDAEGDHCDTPRLNQHTDQNDAPRRPTTPRKRRGMKNGIHPDLFYDSAEANTRQSVLLVAACTGPRCAALRRLDSANPSHTAGAGDEHADHCGPAERSQSEVVLRAAIRQRRDAILVSVPCLGPCHQGSLTAVGRGVTGPGDQSLSWLGRPTLISRTDLPHRACALADWITGDAPDPDTFPEPLQTDEAPS